jgi:hypothetical protein
MVEIANGYVNGSGASSTYVLDAQTDARNQITNRSSAMPCPESGGCHDGVLLDESQ